ncbi:hypothetical protein D7X32_22295 [Corallococcus carmarthensis]|uniref:Uncharacterized protein n=1 Tax=Corallococcus carmarthensis TaxID=2316728 RepID=A0A3A8JY30_9BACT|nr:hypothetical protein D7X32_22295 [Corallococcus carmarthensis]
MGIIGLVCGFVPSVGVAVGLCVLGICEIVLGDPHPFPGDPPVDLLVGVAVFGWVLLLVGHGCFFVARRESDQIVQFWRWVMLPLTLASFLVLSPAFAQIAGRHWGEWGHLKDLLQDNEARVRAFSSRADGALSEEEFARAKAWFQPVTFHFKTEPEPVKIHLRRWNPPYLGIDFGQGQNAVFDPVTMLCIYSD